MTYIVLSVEQNILRCLNGRCRMASVGIAITCSMNLNLYTKLVMASQTLSIDSYQIISRVMLA